MKKVVISLVLANLLAACGTTTPPADSANDPSASTRDPSASKKSRTVVAAKAGASTPTAVSTTATDPLNDPTSILSKRSVYYPFDVDAVQEADVPVVQAHGKYLSANQASKVRLEGNCDERGSNEYNLGLGQRRADGVKKMLELSGVKPGQVVSISYGEEKPKASGHDEASWAQNRRTDLNYAR